MLSKDVRQEVLSRGGSGAHVSLYLALMRVGQREPADFLFSSGDINFIMSLTHRALAVLDPAGSQRGAIEMRAAGLGSGIELRIVEEAAAYRNPDRLASWMVTGV